jgi:hypothetical protein
MDEKSKLMQAALKTVDPIQLLKNGDDQYSSVMPDLKRFAESIINQCIELIVAEQDKAEQEWQCKDGIHIAWKIDSYFKS